MQIVVDDLSAAEVAAFLEDHIRDMRSVSPPESKHALDLDGLRRPEITFWTAWEEGELVGCGALKELGPTEGEIKSMRTRGPSRGRGVAADLLAHIVAVANSRGYERLNLETGSTPFFEPARCLYSKFGFEICAPFGDYKEDSNSVFMTKRIGA